MFKNCDNLKVKLQPYDEQGCETHILRPVTEMKQGKCYNLPDFTSYQAYPHQTKYADMNGRNCTVTVYDDGNCRGNDLSIGDLRTRAGVCGNARFFSRVHKLSSPRQARSARFYCVPDNWQADQAAAAAAKKKAAPKPSTSCTACPTPIGTVVAIIPTTVQTSVSPTTSSTLHTATIVSTTTIIATDVATVSGTTTKYVPVSTSVETFTVTYTGARAQPARRAADAKRAKRDNGPTPSKQDKQDKQEKKDKKARKADKKEKKKNRGPIGKCYGWDSDEMTVTDCDDVGPPPPSATPKLALWSAKPAVSSMA